MAGGVAPVLGGLIAQWLSASNLSVIVTWTSPLHSRQVSILSFAHWEFLFALSAAMGTYVLRALTKIRERSDVSERVVIQELARPKR